MIDPSSQYFGNFCKPSFCDIFFVLLNRMLYEMYI